MLGRLRLYMHVSMLRAIWYGSSDLEVRVLEYPGGITPQKGREVLKYARVGQLADVLITVVFACWLHVHSRGGGLRLTKKPVA